MKNSLPSLPNAISFAALGGLLGMALLVFLFSGSQELAMIQCQQMHSLDTCFDTLN